MARRSRPHLCRECDEGAAGTNDFVQMAQTPQSERALDLLTAVSFILKKTSSIRAITIRASAEQ